MMTTEINTQTNTVIIGASAAGLAVAACLQEQKVPFILLEKSSQVGAAWRSHYDRLHLHTDRAHSQLPYLPMPKSFAKYPARADVVTYLEEYARHFRLEPRFGQEVQQIRPSDGRWQVETQDTQYQAQNVVIATGYTRVPHIPTWPGQDLFPGSIIHSSAYKNGKPYAGQRVLVVGFGNSAGEIAIDLVEHGAAEVGMAVRHPVNVIPRDYLGIPILSIGIVMDKIPAKVADVLAIPMLKTSIGDLTKYGLPKLPYGPNVQIREDRQIPILDIGTVKLIKNGRIHIHPGIIQFNENGVIFSNGAIKPFDAIILGTGYRPQVNDFLQMPGVLNEDGAPPGSGQEAAPGLYFCGFYISPTGMLREIGIEARRISRHIVGKG
ncbi:MAG TPA: NAD(P)/FAD-dependent oxidoreductase [Chloroflexota bacterium]|nr:NAD(P)/FAD-dependent oxidoreductase [Chloroflexota bacterium]